MSSLLDPRHILVATDFSPASTRALDVAASWAKDRGAGICLLHVAEPPSVVIPELALDPQLEEDLRQQATDQLAAAADALRARGLVVEERLEIGSPPAQVISIGSHGRGGLGRAVMGSVAARVLHHATTPVFVVRTPAE